MSGSKDTDIRDCGQPEIEDFCIIFDDVPESTFVLRRGEVVTRKQLLARSGASRAAFDGWRARGLEPLETGTKEELYSTDEVIEVWQRRTPK